MKIHLFRPLQQYKQLSHIKCVGINKLFALSYSDKDAESKRFKTQGYYLRQEIIDNCNITINGKTFMTKQLILILKDMKKLENQQHDKVKITLLDVY